MDRMTVIIKYSKGLREKALRVKEYLERHGLNVMLKEVEDCVFCVWEIWFPWGVAKDPDVVLDYYRIFRSKHSRDCL